MVGRDAPPATQSAAYIHPGGLRLLLPVVVVSSSGGIGTVVALVVMAVVVVLVPVMVVVVVHACGACGRSTPTDWGSHSER